MKEWTKTTAGALYIFLFSCIIPFISILFYIIYLSFNHPYRKFCSDNKIILALYICITAILIIIISGIFLGFSKNIFTRFKLWILKIIKPLTWGSLIGFILCSSYLLSVIFLDKEDDYDSIFATFFTIYVACCGFFIGFYGIYIDKTPILDIETLMDYLVDDLNACKKILFWCYPGLSFGSVTVGGKRYELLYKALDYQIQHGEADKEFFIYNAEEIEALYEPYLEKAREGKIKNFTLDKVKVAIDDSKYFIKEIDKRKGNKPKHAGSLDYDFSIPNFRFQVIITDNIVYLLNAIGLPFKFNDRYEFTYQSEHQSPVDFVVYRINNSKLANQLIKQIKLEHEKSKENYLKIKKP